MSKTKYNCPNCAAPIEGEKCPYCGTVIYDFAALEIGVPSYIKVRYDGKVMMCRVIVDSFDVGVTPHYVTYYADNLPIRIPQIDELTLSFEAHGVPDEDGTLMKVIQEGER